MKVGLLVLVLLVFTGACAYVHFGQGTALYKKGDLDGAIAELREAIRLKPDYADAHCSLGIALAGKGDLDGAIAELREAIRLGRTSRTRTTIWATHLRTRATSRERSANIARRFA